MARVKLSSGSFVFILLCASYTIQVELKCEVASVKVENEDGRTQIFDLKKLESAEGEACALCAHPAVNTAPRFVPLKSSLILSVSERELSKECDPLRLDLPSGLCTFNSDLSNCLRHETDLCSHSSEELADEILARNLVPMATGDDSIDRSLAVGLVMLNSGQLDGALQTLDGLISTRPNTVAAYFMRGVTNTRRGLKEVKYAQRAVDDFNEVLGRDPDFIQAYVRRAEAYIILGKYNETVKDLSKVIQHSSNIKSMFARGVIYLLLQDFTAAETDFRSALEAGSDEDTQSLFYLGLAQYYRGKVRNSIDVFKQVLKKDPDHLEACTSLAQAFREVGNIRASRSKFNHSLEINKYHVLTLQLRGDLMYHSGEPLAAHADYKKCLREDPSNINCGYMSALSSVAMGQYYTGVKEATKVMVQNTQILRASSEFMKAHYLREYARYLHANLDQPLQNMDIEEDFPEEYRDHWLKGLPFEFQASYKEQPGIQPHIKDVAQFQLSDYSRATQNLICRAHKIGWLMQVNSDGYTPNKRLNLAMGLTSIHIAQLYEARWRGIRQNKPFDGSHSWRELFDIAVRYRRLVDPEQPVLWLDQLPDHKLTDGYKTVITLVKGSVHNIKTLPYFDLVFRLVKTMLERYSVSSDPGETKTKTATKEEIDNAKSCEDLLAVTKAGLFTCTPGAGSEKYQSNQNGFVVSTQVPSFRKPAESSPYRLEGALLVLTDDSTQCISRADCTDAQSKQILFTIDIANTRSRTIDYHAELDYIYNQLQDEIRRGGSSKITDMESVINTILSLSYYFYNLMPLSRGSSVVAYSVALGLIMSVGRHVTGKMPTGKLLEMEAMLSGAPDAFILVTKQWMNIKRLSSPMSAHPTVWETFPTVRHVLEVLNVNTDACS